MSILNFIKSGGASKSFIIDPSKYRDGFEYWHDGNGHNTFKYDGCKSSLTAYQKCPPLTAIINKKAQAFINGKIWLLNTQGKAKGKESQGPVATKIRALFRNPNPIQSGKEFEAQNYIYQQLAGFVIVLPIKPLGFPLIDATALWNVPPQMLEIKEKKFRPYSITSVKDMIESVHVVTEGERTLLDLERIIIIKDFTPSFSSLIFPDSRIKANEQPINNIIGAYESRGVIIQRRGPKYVVSNRAKDQIGTSPMMPEEKDEVQRQFGRDFGITKKQSMAIITSASIDVTPIGFSVKDLMLFEEIEGSTMSLCDAYGYPYRLMAAEKAASYNDVREFKKMLYQDTTIPEGENIYEQWGQKFQLENEALEFNKDFSHVAVLQEDEQKKGSARLVRNRAYLIEWQAGLITMDEWRVANGDDPMPDERGKLYYSEYNKLYGAAQINSGAAQGAQGGK